MLEVSKTIITTMKNSISICVPPMVRSSFNLDLSLDNRGHCTDFSCVFGSQHACLCRYLRKYCRYYRCDTRRTYPFSHVRRIRCLSSSCRFGSDCIESDSIPLFEGIVHTFGALKVVNELMEEEALEYGVIKYDEKEEGNRVQA